jgi:hypothetical protein
MRRPPNPAGVVYIDNPKPAAALDAANAAYDLMLFCLAQAYARPKGSDPKEKATLVNSRHNPAIWGRCHAYKEFAEAVLMGGHEAARCPGIAIRPRGAPGDTADVKNGPRRVAEGRAAGRGRELSRWQR